MTLITFQSRIHFASGVLEEAFRAEIEDRGHRTALLICDHDVVDTDLAERVQNGVPHNVDAMVLPISSGQDKYHTASAAQALVPLETEIIVGFGSARAIAHARKCRQSFAAARYAARRKTHARAGRERDYLPDFIVIPGVDGLPDPCMASGVSAERKTSPPSVIICDPTVMEDAGHDAMARVYAETLGRCLAALGLTSFNPLADGLAVEGLRRLTFVAHMIETGHGDAIERRELMAASLNSAIAQQKGPGLVQAYTFALSSDAHRDVDAAALHRILLPRLLQEQGALPEGHDSLVQRVLDLPRSISLSQAVDDLLAPLPIETSLRELDLSRAICRGAVQRLARENRVAEPDAASLDMIVDELY